MRLSLGLSRQISLAVLLGTLIVGTGSIIAAVFILNADSSQRARDSIDLHMRAAWAQLRHVGTTFQLEDGKLKADGIVLNNRMDLVDGISAITGGSATIFAQDVRVATSVKKDDGSRATGTQLARNAAYESVFTHKTAYRGEVDILGTRYVTGYDPILDQSGTVIGILFVGTKAAQFYQASDLVVMWIVIVIVICAIFGVALTTLVSGRYICNPINQIVDRLSQLGRGETEGEIPYLHRSDEVGLMAKAVSVFKEEQLQLSVLTEQDKINKKASERRFVARNKMVSDLENKVMTIINGVVSASAELDHSARNLVAVSEISLEKVTTVSSSVETAATNVETVSAASEELSASSREIASHVQHANKIAGSAAEEANKTDELVRGLVEAAAKIGDVVSLINDIASQTNLLALNATIEAARAGDAGKGFAVVANEVKHLASQTAKATDEISQQISDVQSRTQGAVDAIKTISETIEEMNEVSNAIMVAIHQQSDATMEISRNIQQAHAGTQDAADNTTIVRNGVADSTKAAHQVMNAADDLDNQAMSLRSVLDGFLLSFKVAGNSSITWGDNWLTGISAIDQDHQKLVNLTNELSQSIADKKDREAIGKVFAGLLAYIREHFSREEEIWRSGNLPSAADHKRVHADLAKQVTDYEAAYRAGTTEISEDLLEFLRTWLIEHVFQSDKLAAERLKRMAKVQ